MLGGSGSFEFKQFFDDCFEQDALSHIIADLAMIPELCQLLPSPRSGTAEEKVIHEHL